MSGSSSKKDNHATLHNLLGSSAHLQATRTSNSQTVITMAGIALFGSIISVAGAGLTTSNVLRRAWLRDSRSG